MSNMINRRKFIQASAFTGFLSLLGKKVFAMEGGGIKGKPVVISTWDAGLRANKAAWEILSNGGRALDAVEKGVMVTEGEQSCCVGLGANPDRDGFVTLDACIMDEFSNCGSVAFLERIKHPISVARRVMEKTPHVMLVGIGAQQFAVAEGFPLEEQKLSADAQKNYDNWLKRSEYKPPVINMENKKDHGPFAPSKLDNGEWNHDTIGMVAMDASGNLSGSCTTSGAGFKCGDAWVILQSSGLVCLWTMKRGPAPQPGRVKM
jgi:N4-(beta-N-acetylglucosaminyl)-L-asparaginase